MQQLRASSVNVLSEQATACRFRHLQHCWSLPARAQNSEADRSTAVSRVLLSDRLVKGLAACGVKQAAAQVLSR